MKKIEFTKMVASGNDFIIAEIRNQKSTLRLRSGLMVSEVEPSEIKKFTDLARKICDRKFGVGADGLLILAKSKVADVKMRIFNADGSEAEMCGNGARCVALWAKSEINPSTTLRVDGERSRTIKNQKSKINIETKAGIIESEVKGGNVKIKLTDPKHIKLDIPIRINQRTLKVNFINTGVPHTVIFVEGLDKIDVTNLARFIRYHRKFAPTGTNVNFVEVLNNNSLRVRTYERGVEDETLACGTGAVASALITNYILRFTNYGKINVRTKGGEILKVYFQRDNNKFKNVWLEGKAKIVYKGCWCDYK